jgi:hypothetical protein
LQSTHVHGLKRHPSGAGWQDINVVEQLKLKTMKMTIQNKQNLTLATSGFFADQLEDLFAELEQVELQMERRSIGKKSGKTALKSPKMR